MIEEPPKETFEVRDLRGKERYVVDDRFLNGYARFVGIYAVGIYNSLCRHAGKDQKSWPSVNRMAQELDIGRNSVIEAVKRLEFWRIIRKMREGKKLNNRYDLLDRKYWKPLSEVCLKDFSEVCQINFISLQGKLHEFTGQTSIVRKHISKETHSKELVAQGATSGPVQELSPPGPNRPIEEHLIYWFKDVNPSVARLFSNTNQRKAMIRLIEQHGREKLEGIIKLLFRINSMPYSPTITTPVELEVKLGQLLAFMSKEKLKADKGKIDVSVRTTKNENSSDNR